MNDLPSPPTAAPRFAPERQQHIAEALRQHGRVEVGELALRFGVSEDTVRRDLRQLAARGLVQKTHGGAVAINVNALPAVERADLLPAAKLAIALAAAALVEPHHTLFVDGGSTTLALARALCAPGAPRPLTVVTHALDVAHLLAEEPQVHLVLAGGTWLPGSRVFQGEQAVATLRAHRADIAFLGACGLHQRAGLTANEAGEAAIKRAMVDGAAVRVLLSDASKLGTVAPCAVARIDELDRLISDAAPDWLPEHVVVQTVAP